MLIRGIWSIEIYNIYGKRGKYLIDVKIKYA